MTKAKIIEKPKKKPKTKRRKKKPPEEVAMSGKDPDPPVNGQDNQKLEDAKEEGMNNGDLTAIAKYLSQNNWFISWASGPHGVVPFTVKVVS